MVFKWRNVVLVRNLMVVEKVLDRQPFCEYYGTKTKALDTQDH